MHAHGAAPRGGTRGHGNIKREQPNHSTHARLREARRQRDRERLEAAWLALTTQGARP